MKSNTHNWTPVYRTADFVQTLREITMGNYTHTLFKFMFCFYLLVSNYVVVSAFYECRVILSTVSDLKKNNEFASLKQKYQTICQTFSRALWKKLNEFRNMCLSKCPSGFCIQKAMREQLVIV